MDLKFYEAGDMTPKLTLTLTDEQTQQIFDHHAVPYDKREPERYMARALWLETLDTWSQPDRVKVNGEWRPRGAA
jgi:hypothetical protein